MSTHSGLPLRAIGIGLLVLGAGLSFWGLQLSGSFGAQITSAVTGAETNKVMMFYITGAVCFSVGLYLFIKNSKFG